MLDGVENDDIVGVGGCVDNCVAGGVSEGDGVTVADGESGTVDIGVTEGVEERENVGIGVTVSDGVLDFDVGRVDDDVG